MAATKGVMLAGSRRGHRVRGQSMVEFTLILPVLIIILLVAVDFGRVFFSWVTINNAARAGATYAATHPHGWDANGDPEVQTEYVAVIDRETTTLNCDLKFPRPPKPLDTGANGLAVGSRLESDVSCDFHPLTPLVSNFFGGVLHVNASAVFAIRVGIPGVNPPLPPCFGQAEVPPDLLGMTPTDAQLAINLAGLVPVADPTWPSGTRNVVRAALPAPGSCQPFGTIVTYRYRP